jgi:hypothetical protein
MKLFLRIVGHRLPAKTAGVVPPTQANGGLHTPATKIRRRGPRLNGAPGGRLNFRKIEKAAELGGPSHSLVSGSKFQRGVFDGQADVAVGFCQAADGFGFVDSCFEHDEGDGDAASGGLMVITAVSRLVGTPFLPSVMLG